MLRHTVNEDGSLTLNGDARTLAQSLYELWLGASVLAKVHRSPAPMDTATATATATTRQLLGL